MERKKYEQRETPYPSYYADTSINTGEPLPMATPLPPHAAPPPQPIVLTSADAVKAYMAVDAERAHVEQLQARV